MVVVSLFFILFGAAVLMFPDLLRFLVGFFFIIMGLNLLIGYFLVKRKFKKTRENVFDVFGYKVYKDKDKG